MSNIELRSTDLVIRTFKDRDTGDDREIVSIRFDVAVDEVFLTECREKGVKTREKVLPEAENEEE